MSKQEGNNWEGCIGNVQENNVTLHPQVSGQLLDYFYFQEKKIHVYS
jgi:hypothetical protein